MKILVIDKNLLDPLHRTKWRCLAEHPGITLTAVCPDRWVENYRSRPFTARVDDGISIHGLPVIWPGFENRAFYRHGLSAAVREARPDVIVAFEEPFSLFALQAVAARGAAGTKPPLVLYTWDNLAHGRHYAYRPAAFYAWAERFVMRHAALIGTANEEGRTSFARRYPVTARHLPFGLDLSAFRPAEMLPSGVPVIGYIGRLLPMKGIDTLLEASAALELPHRLVLLGSGPDHERLVARAAQLNVTDRVTFLEAVPPDEVRRILTTMSLLVLPSRTTPTWKEQFGRVIVEAMAAGVPVVGSSSGAIPEVIGEAGVVFPEGDAGALARRLSHLLARPYELLRLRHAGIARAREYSAERFAERMAAALAEVVGTR